MSDLQECIYLSWHESVKIQQYVGIKFGKDVVNKIKYSKVEMAVTQSEGTAFGLKKEMESKPIKLRLREHARLSKWRLGT
jgi:hypothetical protein